MLGEIDMRSTLAAVRSPRRVRDEDPRSPAVFEPLPALFGDRSTPQTAGVERGARSSSFCAMNPVGADDVAGACEARGRLRRRVLVVAPGGERVTVASDVGRRDVPSRTPRAAARPPRRLRSGARRPRHRPGSPKAADGIQTRARPFPRTGCCVVREGDDAATAGRRVGEAERRFAWR